MNTKLIGIAVIAVIIGILLGSVTSMIGFFPVKTITSTTSILLTTTLKETITKTISATSTLTKVTSITKTITLKPETRSIVSPNTTISVTKPVAHIRSAKFKVENLKIIPAEVYIGDNVTIKVDVTNTGDVKGNYLLTLKINNAVEAAKNVILLGKETKTVKFTVTKPIAGNYTLEVDGLTRVLSVKIPVPIATQELLTKPGNPAVKRTFQLPEWLPSDYLDYDEENYHVFSKMIHGTEVVVAIHKDFDNITEIAGYPTVSMEELCKYIFDTFHRYWLVFGGYPYDKTIWVVRSLSDPRVYYSATAIGTPVTAERFKTEKGQKWGAPHPYTKPFYKEWFAHEMFHMWNGAIIGPATTMHGTGYLPESWFVEGATVYYSARAAVSTYSLKEYNEILLSRINTYMELVGTKYDLPFKELAANTPAPPEPGKPSKPNKYTHMIYAKGCLVAYLLDKELLKYGKNLDDLMRYMYENYGLTKRRYTNQDILNAVNIITRANFTDFFNKYIYGNTTISIGMDYIDHVFNTIRPNPELKLLHVGKATLIIKVVEVDGSPISNLEVCLWTAKASQGAPKFGCKMTNASGIVIFRGLSLGDYLIGFNLNNFPEKYVYPGKILISITKEGTTEKVIKLKLKQQ
jgi:hypothetical protein